MHTLDHPAAQRPQQGPGDATPISRSLLSMVLWLLACVFMPLWLVGCGGGDEPAAPPSVTQAIGAAGGSITGPDGVVLSIPADALSTTTTFRIARNDAGAPLLGGLRPISGIYEVTPHGREFASSARIQIPYDAAQVPAGARAILIRAQPGGEWSMIDAQEQGVATLAGDTPGLSFYAVGTCYTSALASVPGPDPLVACPAAHSLTISILDGTVAVPVVRDVNTGTVLPVMTIASPTRLRVGIRYTRPPSGREDFLGMSARAGVATSITPNDWPRALSFGTDGGNSYAGLQTERNIDLDPATVPGAASPGGVIVRFRASVSTEFDAFYPGCLCFKKAAWTYVAEIPVRVIGTATPPPVTYTVGGNVTGLTGSGLVLQNNGAGNLAIATDGAFTFASPVVAGSTYAVTVQTQPNGQTCSVTGGSGTASGPVSTIAINCVASNGNWQGAERRELTADGVEGSSAKVRFDAAGNALLVWAQGNGSFVRRLWTSRYSPSSGWSAPTLRDTGGGAVAGGDLAVEANGNAILVWSETDGTNYNVWARRFISGSWGSAAPIENDPGWALDARAGVDGNGNAIATWMLNTGTNTQPLYRLVSARLQTGSWQTPVFVSAPSAQVGQPRLAVHANGSADAVWVQLNGAGLELWSSHFNGSVWSSPTAVDPGGQSEGLEPQLAHDGAGNTLLVWTQSGSNLSEVFASQRSAGGAWSAPVRMRTSSNAGAASAELAMNAVGQAAVVWLEDEGGTSASLWTRSFLPATGWTTATRLEVPGGYGLQPRVALNAAGSVVIGWARNNVGTGVDADMVAFRGSVTSSSGWSGPAVLSQGGMAGAAWGDVAIDTSGNALAVWQQFDVARSSALDLWSNLFR